MHETNTYSTRDKPWKVKWGYPFKGVFPKYLHGLIQWSTLQTLCPLFDWIWFCPWKEHICTYMLYLCIYSFDLFIYTSFIKRVLYITFCNWFIHINKDKIYCIIFFLVCLSLAVLMKLSHEWLYHLVSGNLNRHPPCPATGYPPCPATGYPPCPATGYPPCPATAYPPYPATGYPPCIQHKQ